MERVHQTIGNIIHTFIIQEMDIPSENPWEGILSCLNILHIISSENSYITINYTHTFMCNISQFILHRHYVKRRMRYDSEKVILTVLNYIGKTNRLSRMV